MSLTSSLQSAVSGLTASQRGLEIVSNNVSNVNTEGYTRKVFSQKTNVLGGEGNGVLGTEYRRVVDENLLKDFLKTNANSSSLEEKFKYLDRLQASFGTPQDDYSISHQITELKNAFESFALDVNNSTNQARLVSQAENAAQTLSTLSEQIQSLRLEADVAIAQKTEEVNNILERLDDLNDEIVAVKNINVSSTADLLDQRDQALKELSELVDISYFTRNSGEIVVMTSTGETLLDTEPKEMSHYRSAQTSAWSAYTEDSVMGIFVSGEDITNKIEGGIIGGLVELRDSDLPQLQAEIDELSYNLKNEVNKIHNMGSAFPEMTYQITGSRQFIDTETAITPTAQQIAISDGDVKIVIFDKDGKQVANTSLVNNLGFANGIIHDSDNPNDPTTMTGAIQTWLRDPAGGNLATATVGVNEDGQIVLDLGDSDYGIAFRDEINFTEGSEQTNVTIDFDSDGDGAYDRQYTGFSNFFGLNDFFVNDSSEFVYDSQILESEYNLGLAGNTTMYFSDETNGIRYSSIEVSTNDSIYDIADKINENDDLLGKVSAQIVREGVGFRLRIVNTEIAQLEITESPAVGLTTNMDLKPSKAGLSGNLIVRADIKQNPAKISKGPAQFDEYSGEYFVSESDNNTIANKMAELFTQNIRFDEAGAMPTAPSTLSEYAATIVSNFASETQNVESLSDYQTQLKESVEKKSAEISDVNLDQELSQLIIFQQSYSAAAQVISTTSSMMDTLIQMVG